MASGDDWFAPSFVTNADQVAATQVAPLADDPNLIGCYTDSELDWGPDGTDSNTVLEDYLALPAGSPGWPWPSSTSAIPTGSSPPWPPGTSQVTTAAVRKYDPNHLILGVKAEGQEIQPQLLEAASPMSTSSASTTTPCSPGWPRSSTRSGPSTCRSPRPSQLRAVREAARSWSASTRSSPADRQTPDTVPGVYAVYRHPAARAAA